uniref:M3 family oligoendopeptidase n=1 Tax=Candidatus Scatomorpha intestinigallinarum TaxID=2840923 RepID=UPI0040294644
MRFEDIHYVRPDAQELSRLSALTQLARSADSAQELARAIREVNDIDKHVYTMLTAGKIRYAQNTQDPFYRAEQAHIARAEAEFSLRINAFYTAASESPFADELSGEFPVALFNKYRLKNRAVSPAVIGELEEESRLIAQYRKLESSIFVEFNGKNIPEHELSKYMNSPDRETRRAAYLAHSACYDARQDEYNAIFSELVKVRTSLARKLGEDSFIRTGYLRLAKDCYGETDVSSFRQEVKKHVVPLVEELRARQAKRIGLSRLCAYDNNIQFLSGNPKPVLLGDALVRAGFDVYRQLCDEGAEFVDSIISSGTFDLFPRNFKNNVAYCEALPEYGLPFIFANLNGTASDVSTFTHELGHAFAGFLAAKSTDIFALQDPTYESCEVQGMAMEFLSWPYYESFYGPEAGRVKLMQLIDALEFIPYGCMVDEFQHIMYAQPELTAAERQEVWLALEATYRPYLDISDIPLWRDGRVWHRQSHIFTVPFYYIDYCLAQLISIQLLELMLREGHAEAFSRYRRFVEPGGTLSFSKLVEAAGLKNPFELGTVEKTVNTAFRILTQLE